jgi:outer membrane protein OmpA-like peptidoglycan-associated protein
MNKLFILVGFTLNFSLLFSQECNKNVYTEDEVTKLSNYAKNLEKSIIEKNPKDTALIAKLQGDYSTDLCGYNDESVIKISNYLKELEKLDTIDKIVKEEIVDTLSNKDNQNEKGKESFNLRTNKNNSLNSMETLLFSPNSSQIKSAKFTDLIKELKADTKSKIIIDGYTDGDASDKYNLELSKKRANAVKSYLISKGIDKSRIIINAYGEQKPIADNKTIEGKAKNRRVVISVK